MARTKKKSLKSALELLQSIGVEIPQDEILHEKVQNEEAQREHPKHFRNLAKNREMEAEGALFFLRMTPSKALIKRCRYEHCQSKFMTNYNSISYCCNDCRRLDLKQNFAIKWNDQLAEEQWGIYEPGLSLTGPAIKAMISVLERLGYSVQSPLESQDQAPSSDDPEIVSEPVGEGDVPQNDYLEPEKTEKGSDSQLGLNLQELHFSFLDDLSL